MNNVIAVDVKKQTHNNNEFIDIIIYDPSDAENYRRGKLIYSKYIHKKGQIFDPTIDNDLKWLAERLIQTYEEFYTENDNIRFYFDKEKQAIYTDKTYVDLRVVVNNQDIVVYYIYDKTEKFLNSEKIEENECEIYQDNSNKVADTFKDPITKQMIPLDMENHKGLAPIMYAVKRIRDSDRKTLETRNYSFYTRPPYLNLGGQLSTLRIGNKNMKLYIKMDGKYVTVKQATSIYKKLKAKPRKPI